MTQTKDVALEPLSQSELTLADPNADIRGRVVYDREGEEIGRVNDLIVDREEARVRFLELASGGFLGIGEESFLVPVDVITRLEGDAVHIDRTREHVAGGPAYEPEVITELDRDPGLYNLYTYYGYPPFWDPAYTYPAYPYYPAR